MHIKYFVRYKATKAGVVPMREPDGDHTEFSASPFSHQRPPLKLSSVSVIAKLLCLGEAIPVRIAKMIHGTTKFYQLGGRIRGLMRVATHVMTPTDMSRSSTGFPQRVALPPDIFLGEMEMAIMDRSTAKRKKQSHEIGTIFGGT